eukprot:490095_1
MSENKEEKEENLESYIDKIDENGFYKDGGIREIGVFYEIMRVSNIDTANSTFEAQFELQFTWLVTKEDIESFKNDKENYKPSFIPKYNWTNASEINLEMDECGYEILENGGTDTWGNEIELPVPFVNAVLYNGSGTFFVPTMDLTNFPFDVVDLSIELECQQSSDKVIFVPSFDVSNEVVDVTPNCQLLNPAFKLHKPLSEVVLNDCDGAKYACFMVHLKFERYWSTYSSIYMTLCALCLCTLSVFTLDSSDHLNDRLANIFTMLLTVVAYEFVLKSDLPKIPYYTKADIYIISCFIYIIIIALEVVIVGIVDHDNIDYYDTIGLYIIIIGFVLWNIIYCLIVFIAKRNEMDKLQWYYADFMDDDDDDEDDTTVSHSEFRFDKGVEKLLGKYWEEHLNDTDDESNDNDSKNTHFDNNDEMENKIETQLELNKSED